MRGVTALALCILLAGCTQPDLAPPAAPTDPNDSPAGTGTETQTNSLANSNSTPSPKEPSANTTEPSFNTSSSVSDPVRDPGMRFDVADDVPSADLALIRRGLAAAGDYIDADLGGDIPAATLANVTVKVVATGRGNEENGGGGSCCTAFSESAGGGMRPFFDVNHTHWLNRWEGWPADTQRETSVMHEYAHGWQNSLGCINLYWQPLGNWMNEGIAEQVAYAAMIERGVRDKDEVIDFMEMAAKSGNGEEWYTPLSQQTEPGSGIWSGHIGYLALELAMDGAPNGLMQLRDVCVEVAEGATLEEAFEATFGRSLDEFYVEFEIWKAQRP